MGRDATRFETNFQKNFETTVLGGEQKRRTCKLGMQQERIQSPISKKKNFEITVLGGEQKKADMTHTAHASLGRDATRFEVNFQSDEKDFKITVLGGEQNEGRHDTGHM